MEWNSLGNITANASIFDFKRKLSKLFKTEEKLLFCVHDPIYVKLLSELRLNFSQFNDHKPSHEFWDPISV